VSEKEKAELRAEIVSLQMKLGTIKTGLDSVLILLDRGPHLVEPMKSLVQTMIKIAVDEQQR